MEAFKGYRTAVPTFYRLVYIMCIIQSCHDTSNSFTTALTRLSHDRPTTWPNSTLPQPRKGLSIKLHEGCQLLSEGWRAGGLATAVRGARTVSLLEILEFPVWGLSDLFFLGFPIRRSEGSPTALPQLTDDSIPLSLYQELFHNSIQNKISRPSTSCQKVALLAYSISMSSCLYSFVPSPKFFRTYPSRWRNLL